MARDPQVAVGISVQSTMSLEPCDGQMQTRQRTSITNESCELSKSSQAA
jgi:hypothetical protein